MECREGCGACCIVPSISSPIPGMPDGKPAGVACIHLDERMRCRIYGKPERPPVCDRFKADPETCGGSRQEAISRLQELEKGSA